jgi:hypothetical protein
MSERITEQVAAIVEDVIDRAAPGQGIAYEVALVLMPGPEGRPQPLLAVVLTIPSPVLGQGLANTMLIPSLAPEAEQLEGALRNAIEGLQQQRSVMLAGSNGHGGAPGPMTSPSGLILPGQG